MRSLAFCYTDLCLLVFERKSVRFLEQLIIRRFDHKECEWNDAGENKRSSQIEFERERRGVL